MATDKSEPRIGIILKVGVLSVATLVIVHGGLVAYFDAIAHAEEEHKYGDIKPEALLSLRQDESRRLAAGSVPIEKAMQEVANRGRGRPEPEIAPATSKDLAPLAGWTQMPTAVPSEMTAVEVAPPAIPDVAADAGAALLKVDAGAAMGHKPQAGHPTKPPAKKP